MQNSRFINSAAQRAGLVLASEEEVLEAASALPPDGGELVPWSPAAHRRFPPAFRQAVSTLLLHRARVRSMVAAADVEAEAGAAPPQGVVCLDALPEALVQPVVAAMAHPLDLWRP